MRRRSLWDRVLPARASLWSDEPPQDQLSWDDDEAALLDRDYDRWQRDVAGENEAA